MDLAFSGNNVVQFIAAGSMAVKRHMDHLAAQGDGEYMDRNILNGKSKVQILI